MKEKSLTYSLNEIARWQLDFGNSTVELPALQRGFVWKANQIETLWDSILRGFPIGSFLLSKSEDEKYFLLDGQQRATSIALGYQNPWQKEKSTGNKFWSLKKSIPTVWIDLCPSERTLTQKFVIRVVTQSHPWGYQRINHSAVLSVSDRKNALEIFRKNSANQSSGYINLSPLNIFPYDADLPVPLTFLIKSISETEGNWKAELIKLCTENLPVNLKTKHFDSNADGYFKRLEKMLFNPEFDNSIYNAIKNIQDIKIPSIIVSKEILKAEDDQTGEDPTLFVRLNSSGTRIAGDELIYSIYKASFPEAKELVDNIGASFVSPSLVIALVSRLANSELNEGSYSRPLSVNDFLKKINAEPFKNKLKELIGVEENSPVKLLFNQAIDLLHSKGDFAIPPVLVKNLVKNSPDLFLMLLQWIKLNKGQVDRNKRRHILAAITALSWFGTDNKRFVSEIWENLSKTNFWEKEFISNSLYLKNDFIIHPFISPEQLRKYLILNVVEGQVSWDNLYPNEESEIMKEYKSVINETLLEDDKENKIKNFTISIWNNFVNRLFSNKSLILFAQREYINDSFGEFNQMEDLEDTNTPWDWDHIYPDSWVYYQQNISPLTREWNRSIGNFRAMSLEENRSENNNIPPKIRLANVKKQSFIKESDGKYWDKIEDRIYFGNNEMIKTHLSAIINRLCNIYEEWYSTLNVGDLFDIKKQL